MSNFNLFNLFKRNKNTNKIIVDGNPVSADDMGNPDYNFLIGKEGECVTDLKPIGKAKIDGKVYNVRSENGYLYNGNSIVVVKTESSNIYVQKIKFNK